MIRIDASIVNGTRTVDCKLDGPLPPGAVPDLSVDGTVILSYGYWHSAFNGDPGILDRSLMLNSKPYPIVGVMLTRYANQSG